MILTETQKIAHLLRRFGLGASEAELEYYGKNGLTGAINLLLEVDKAPDVVNFDPAEFANQQGVVNIKVMQSLMYMRTLGTQRPLEEKMTLFWHNHFATSSQKVDNSYAMNEHIEVLRKNALGDFKTLLTEVSKNPAMIYWLDNQLNVAGKPNENFAREIMELFTLGVDNYSEKDVQEAARAFTGWRYGNRVRQTEATPRRLDRFVFVGRQHDDGTKNIFGKTGNFNGDEVINMLCERKETAQYITQKAWSWFASTDMDKAEIDRIATKFYNSGLEIKVLVRAIMESPQFYSEKCYRQSVKNPVDFAVVTARQLGAGLTVVERIKGGIENPVLEPNTGVNRPLVRALGPCFALLSSTTSMGMELMSPPDVSGWRTGSYWITSATMVERVKWADRLFIGGPAVAPTNLGAQLGAGRGPSVGVDAWPLFMENPTVEGAAETLFSIFDAELPVAKRQAIVEATVTKLGNRVTRQNSSDVARSISRAIFATPEFQFS